MTRSVERVRARLLFAEVRLMVLLRWVFGGTLVALALVTDRLSKSGGGPDARMLGLGAALLGANVIVLASGVLRPFAARRHEHMHTVAAAQACFDVACLSMLVAWTGGMSSPALYMALPQGMLIAGLLAPARWSPALAGVLIASVAAACWIGGAWPADAAQWGVAGVWSGSLLATMSMASCVTRVVYEREGARTRQLNRIRSMSEELRAQQTALVQNEKLAAMGQIAAGIAHEITNPLASMDSVLQLMQRKPDVPRPDAVNTLRDQVQRILRIVRQLTSYAHPSRGIIDTVSVNEVVRSAVEMLGFSRRAVTVRTALELPESHARVRLNPQAMQQVLTNLLVNAMDAVADVPDPMVTVRTLGDDGTCVIEVSDNGTGIQPHHVPRIFEPFFTTKPVGQGTGLGLSICARLVQEQHGRIEVDTAVSRGTTFRIVLPASGSTLPATELPDRPAPVRTVRAENASSGPAPGLAARSLSLGIE